MALAFHRLRFLTASSWTLVAGRRGGLYSLSGLFLCQKAIAQLFFSPTAYSPPYPPQNDYCNKCTADVCKLNQVEEEVSFHLSGQRERKRERRVWVYVW